MDRIHILHIIDALNYGGAQKLLVTLAAYTPADRFRVSVCCIQPMIDLKGEIEAHGVPVYCLNRARPSVFEPFRLVRYFMGSILDVVRFCRRTGVRVVQCHLSDADMIGITSAVLAGVDRILPTNHFVFSPSGRKPGDPRNFLRNVIARVLFNGFSDCIIAVSENTGKLLESHYGVNPGKIRVIPNGIDVDGTVSGGKRDDLLHSLGLEADDQIVLTAGRLTHQKGHIYLLEAVAKLKTRLPRLKVLLAGDGELKQPLAERCAELGIADRVSFLGNRRDIPALLELSDLFVMPSLWEGTSLALLEGMASGKPVVVTGEPGNTDLIRHMESGYLVPAANADRLAEGMAFMLGNPSEARRMGLEARRIVREGYDARRMVADMEPLWLGKK